MGLRLSRFNLFLLMLLAHGATVQVRKARENAAIPAVFTRFFGLGAGSNLLSAGVQEWLALGYLAGFLIVRLYFERTINASRKVKDVHASRIFNLDFAIFELVLFFPPFILTMVLPPVFNFPLPERLFPLVDVTELPFLFQICGLIIGWGSVALTVWTHLHLSTNWFAGVAVVEGHKLVTSGPYVFVRNPMYVAFIGIMAGLLVNVYSNVVCVVNFAMVSALMVYRIPFEERL